MEQKQPQITIRDIYNVTQRNYDWESFKYVLPRKYVSNSQVKGIDGGVFGNKDNYLDLLQKDKQKIPGPADYKNQGPIIRPKSGKMDKKQRQTYSDEIKSKSNKQNIPGPGAYFKRPQTANHSSKNLQNPDKKDHYLNEVEYLAYLSPGVGEYNLRIDRHVSTPKLFLKAGKTRKQVKQSKHKFFDTISCIDGTFASIKNKGKTKDKNFFGKSKRFITDSSSSKKLGPNTYKINTNWSKQNNLMKTISTKKALFSGNIYYN